VLRLAELAPPALHQVLAGLFATPRLFDLTVTNVRGPQQPIHLAGSRVREIHPLVPLAPDHALGVAVVSHAGSMTFGIVADFDAVPDLDELVAGVRAEHDELRRLAARRARAAHARAVTSAIDGTLP
jgi:diacylglycerol O-acyltransferase